MILSVPICPTCGKPAVGILEVVYATAWISQDKDGTFDYQDESKMHWDTQEPFVDKDGLTDAVCENRHDWKTVVICEPEPATVEAK